MKRNGMTAIVLCFGLISGAWAGLVDAVSIVVNDEPITLYEIYKTEQSMGVDKKKAVEYLVRQKLQRDEMKRLGVQVDRFDVDNRIEQIAGKNGIDSLKLRAVLDERGVDWKTYRKNIREKLLQEKLYSRILSTRIQPPSDETLREYYQLHSDRFSVPRAIRAIQYAAADRKALQEAIASPMAQIPGVSRKAETIPSSKLNPELLYMLTQTPRGHFTQPIPVGGQFVVFYVQDFIDSRPAPFAQVKNRVYAEWMEQKRKEAIKSHFDKLRATADVRVLRAP